MILIYTECKTKVEAAKIARCLVRDRLVACANWWRISSAYIWHRRFCTHTEVALLLKAKDKLFSKVEQRIKELHSYKMPGIISWRITRSSKDYTAWLNKNTP